MLHRVKKGGDRTVSGPGGPAPGLRTLGKDYILVFNLKFNCEYL